MWTSTGGDPGERHGPEASPLAGCRFLVLRVLLTGCHLYLSGGRVRLDISRHEFLSALHLTLKPKVYLEIGVQYGSSLVLAEACDVAYGIDPEPLLIWAPNNQLPNQRVHAMTSDAFFEGSYLTEPIDLAFIDGSHLFEDAMRDFVNVLKRMRPGGVIVFDDVLPYNQEIANRKQPPGDWTGDVWKCFYALQTMYSRGYINSLPLLVDTWPTGTMVLLDVEPRLSLPPEYSNKEHMLRWYPDGSSVPLQILNRSVAVHPDRILEQLNEQLAKKHVL